MDSYGQGRRVDREIQFMNRIAEVCAELALYRIMVNIDQILTHYSKNGASAQIEAALWKLLHEIQRLPLVTKEASCNHRIE